MTTQAITKRDAPIGTVQTTGLTKEGLEESKRQLELLEHYVRNVLRADEDYGVIPGTNGKPSLLKPGAINIAAAFNCHAEATTLSSTLDPIAGFVAYTIRVDLVSHIDGATRASGMGSCTSHESKYRYRNAQPKCPICGKDNIRKSNHGDGFYCWKKTGGCGTNFDADDQDILQQPIGKVENDNPLEQANTILKMATKRAEVDAAMRIPGVARFFTQDLDEMQPDRQESPRDASENPRPSPSTAPGPETQTVRPQPQTNAPTLRSLGDLFNACQKEFGLKSIDTVILLATIAGKPVVAKDIQSVFGSFDQAFAAIKKKRMSGSGTIAYAGDVTTEGTTTSIPISTSTP